MSDVQSKTTKYMKQGNITHKQEEYIGQLKKKKDLKKVEVMKFTDKDVKTVVINDFSIIKDVKDVNEHNETRQQRMK